MPKKINSRQKGARGERQLAQLLTQEGFPAIRGAQRSGGPDSPDVICDALDSFHLECKFTERFKLYDALAQATNDAAGTAIPAVVHRMKNSPWVVVLRLEDFLRKIAPKFAKQKTVIVKPENSNES